MLKTYENKALGAVGGGPLRDRVAARHRSTFWCNTCRVNGPLVTVNVGGREVTRIQGCRCEVPARG